MADILDLNAEEFVEDDDGKYIFKLSITIRGMLKFLVFGYTSFRLQYGFGLSVLFVINFFPLTRLLSFTSDTPKSQIH